jgi:hypothetical protein
MLGRVTLALSAAFLFFAGVPDTAHPHLPLPGLAVPDSFSAPTFLPGSLIAVLPPPSSDRGVLQEQERIEILRYVSGEFAKAARPLPGGKKGFKYVVGKKLDEKDLQNALRGHGTAANPGDTVQISEIEFRAKEIVVKINGGGKKPFHWREHIQVGIGGAATAPPAVDHPNEGAGSTLILDYGRALPDMSADDLMRDLEPFLDFSKQHSAAVNWVDTLPPQFKKAIQDHHAVEGMDHEMVLAALGRPDHKVRERNPDGDETEDWIYGDPPARTIFVTFSGDKVTRVKQYN